MAIIKFGRARAVQDVDFESVFAVGSGRTVIFNLQLVLYLFSLTLSPRTDQCSRGNGQSKVKKEIGKKCIRLNKCDQLTTSWIAWARRNKGGPSQNWSLPVIDLNTKHATRCCIYSHSINRGRDIKRSEQTIWFIRHLIIYNSTCWPTCFVNFKLFVKIKTKNKICVFYKDFY